MVIVDVIKASHTSKILLQDLARKGPSFLHPFKILQDSARSHWILPESCRNLAQNSCKNPASAKSHKIRQGPARMQEKRTFSCKILREHFYWDSNDLHMMHLIQLLVFLTSKYNFWFTAMHVPGG